MKMADVLRDIADLIDQKMGGNAAPNVNDGRTGVFVYRTFGTATTDIYCEVNP
jgi:hypothetical protein